MSAAAVPRRGRTRLAALLLLLGAACAVQADERILDYRSSIDVQADASLRISEEISVRAAGQAIRRGIYRDFPTRYTDRYGVRREVRFEVIEVLRDGRPEAWHQEAAGDGVRVYIGQRDRLLAPGEYRYTLTYRSARQLGYFERHDELYWNVTGNGWAFPIERVTATVRLPETVPAAAILAEAYTGPRGARGDAYSVRIAQDGRVEFVTTRPFARGEGLTIAVGWPKGHVHEPDLGERSGQLLEDNLGLVIGLLGALLLGLYYLGAWSQVGRDPEAGVIIPRYAPPQGTSPAALRFVRRMGYDKKAFSAALVSLAVKGWLEIEQQGHTWTLRRRPGDGSEPLAAGEKTLLDALFAGGSTLALERANQARIRKALKAHEAALRRSYQVHFFATNRGWLAPGWAISLAVFVLALVMQPGRGGEVAAGLFLTVWLTGWSTGVYVLLRSLAAAARRAQRAVDYLLLLPLTAFSLPFVAGELFGLGMLAGVSSWGHVVLLLGLVAVNLLFFELIKAPTRAGRRLLDEIDGLRIYLEVAEKDELAFRHPPEKTPALFERFLPHAIALDVEQRWAERFAGVLAAALADGGSYRPGWYRGGSFDAGAPGHFAGALGGALGGAVAAASASGSSSGGIGGGGSSGGGGGGGGGGGW